MISFCSCWILPSFSLMAPLARDIAAQAAGLTVEPRRFPFQRQHARHGIEALLEQWAHALHFPADQRGLAGPRFKLRGETGHLLVELHALLQQDGCFAALALAPGIEQRGL